MSVSSLPSASTTKKKSKHLLTSADHDDKLNQAEELSIDRRFRLLNISDTPIPKGNENPNQIMEKLWELDISFDANLKIRSLRAMLRREAKAKHPIYKLFAKMSFLEVKDMYHSLIKVTKKTSRTNMEERIANYGFQNFPSGPIEGVLKIINGTDPAGTDHNLINDDKSTQPMKSNGVKEKTPASQVSTSSLPEIEDYSVVLETDRNSIMERLDARCVCFKRTDMTRTLSTLLKKDLEDGHPLNEQVELLKKTTCFSILKHIEPDIEEMSKCKEERLKAKIKKHCFSKCPQSPMKEFFDLKQRVSNITEEQPAISNKAIAEDDEQIPGSQVSTASTTGISDYSVVIENKIESIKERLHFWHVDFDKGERKRVLYLLLKNHLEKNHPINDHIDTIDGEILISILENIEPGKNARMHSDRVKGKIVKHCFQHCATSPLAGLMDLEQRPTVSGTEEPMEVESAPCPAIPLDNPNNLCYLNALVNGLKANKSSRELIGKDTTDVAKKLMTLFDQKSRSTAALRSCLPQHTFSPGQQNDPHEAWLFLLLKLPILSANSLVTFKKTLTCAGCLRSTVTFEKVPCPSLQCRSDTEEMLLFETTEGMEHPRMCLHCKENEQMTEDIIISEASQLLCFVANRYENQAIVVSKNIELGGRRYKVRAVVTHIGENRHSGHYITDIFHQNQWWTVNDARIYKATVEPSGGYLFFYEAVDEPMETGQQQEEMPTTTRSRAKKTNKKAKTQRAVDAKVQQEQNVAAMKAIRREGIQNLNNKKSNSSDIRSDNPAIMGGVDMDQDLDDNYVMSEPCIVCNAAWFKKDIGPITKKCTKCAGERNLEIPTYGRLNHMVPGPQPDCLRNLTYIEECCIKKATPLLHLYCRKGGLTGTHGNVITFEQDLSVLVTILPRLPKDLPFIVLQTQGQNSVELTVRPENLRAALLYLIAHNPAYHDVVLSEENLQFYEQSEGQVIGLPELRYDWEQSKRNKEKEQLPDHVPEKDDITEEMLFGDMPFPESIVPKVNQTSGVVDQLLKATKWTDDNGQPQQSTHKVGEGGDVEMDESSDEEPTLSKNARKKSKKKAKKAATKTLHEGEKLHAWPTRGSKALSEFTTVGINSM